MAGNVKRRQKSLERKAAKRKQKKRAMARQAVQAPTTPRALLRRAAHWPLHECLVSDNWDKPGQLVQILVARRSADGQIAVGVFLVDLGCLGVKSAFARVFEWQSEYEQTLRERMTRHQEMDEADLNLAAKIIREGIAYARQFGFSPDPDYHDAAVLLGGADPDACDVEIPLGVEGKPFYFAGPYDNASRILAKLEKAVGPGNYHFTVPVEDVPELLLEEDEVLLLEDEEEEEEGDDDEDKETVR